MIKAFLDDNFLLQNSVAEQLYHQHAKSLPIIDYHNHLPPNEIASNKVFSSITEAWLKGDHYKWRAMRANGIDEKFITGQAEDKAKFSKWAETVPYTMRNPLFHWTHLELQRYFGIQELLSPNTANKIFEQTTAQLQEQDFSTIGLLQKMNVETVCTTDHPTDSLERHQSFSKEKGDLKMLPTFRPDKLIVIDNEDFLSFFQKLEELEGNNISTFDAFLAALENRMEHFEKHGCQLADHGLSQLHQVDLGDISLDNVLQKRRNNIELSPLEVQVFQMESLHQLAKLYHEKNWTMQFHLGALRNNNSRLLKTAGADVGCDSIGDFSQAEGLSYFLNRLDKEEKLAKTILYNLNPRDNELFATMMGNFNDGSSAGKIQWGSAWWFLDQKDGMQKQINTLSNMGLLSRFIGMLTDSRSFLSFPRHEYFRRILCNMIGCDVHNGELPNDLNWLGEMVENICYKNAKTYFDF